MLGASWKAGWKRYDFNTVFEFDAAKSRAIWWSACWMAGTGRRPRAEPRLHSAGRPFDPIAKPGTPVIERLHCPQFERRRQRAVVALVRVEQRQFRKA